MTAGRFDFQIEQGATFREIFRWRESDGTTPVDLTGTTAKMQAWDNDHRNKLIDFNTQGSITVDGEAGEVTVELLDDKTSALTFDIARYDLKLTSPNTDKTRLIQGRRRLSRQETV
jgi:FlaG/FlaF family flagellin (archaellin)